MANNFTLINESGQLPAAKATLYTVPAGVQTVIKTITVVNTDTASIRINIYLNSSGTSRLISPQDMTLDTGNVIEFDKVYTLAAGDLIEGDASAATVADYTINGVQET